MKAPVAYLSIGIALSLFAASEHKQGNCVHTTRRNACIENEDKAYSESHRRAVLSTGVEIPAKGVPMWEGGQQYTTRTEKRPTQINDEATYLLSTRKQ